jgi:hypothetical protein
MTPRDPLYRRFPNVVTTLKFSSRLETIPELEEVEVAFTLCTTINQTETTTQTARDRLLVPR